MAELCDGNLRKPLQNARKLRETAAPSAELFKSLQNYLNPCKAVRYLVVNGLVDQVKTVGGPSETVPPSDIVGNHWKAQSFQHLRGNAQKAIKTRFR